MSADEFSDFIRRIRAGDARAAEELVRQYSAVVRMEVRGRLQNPRLRRLFDSMDICQSVFVSFFARAALGQYVLGKPEDLVGLLVVIAKRKVAYHARRQQTLSRGHGQLISLLPGHDVTAPGPSPSQAAEAKLFLEEFRKRLTPEESRLADLVSAGHTWPEIAALCGGNAHALRVQLGRAVKRVSREMGLDGGES